MNTSSILQSVAAELHSARRLLFITGAGISADSGLPTYRGVGGLYNHEATEDGMEIEDALSGDCLVTHPEITWKYLLQIRQNCQAVLPNAAHRAIAALERTHEVVVLTQNIDGLHGQAGSSRVIEIHGNQAVRYCMRCHAPADASDCSLPPRCACCGGVVRPGVVLFGESLHEAALMTLQEELDQGFDMVFVIGTTAVFPYIAAPVMQAARLGIPTVEINPARTRLSSLVRYYVPLGAVEAFAVITGDVRNSEERSVRRQK